MSTQGQLMKYARGNRRRKEVLDLNVPPLVETLDQSVGPAMSAVQGGQGGVPAAQVAHSVPAQQPVGPTPPARIDLEDLDDDVVISSPRAFEEARRKSRRSRRTVVVDVESEEATRQANKRRRANPPIINCEFYVNLEGSSGSTMGRPQYVAPPPPPPEPVFSCPVCMGPLVEEVTTKCGHIFCKECIKAAISAQHKCPTCRRKITNKDIIRVYLPTAK